MSLQSVVGNGWEKQKSWMKSFSYIPS
jgi:hypothetical protein